MGQTVVEKITQRHMSAGPSGRPVRAGDFVSIRPRHVMTHDNTSPVMSKFRASGAKRVHDPRQPVFALDYDIQNTSEDNLIKYRAIEAFARSNGIDFYPAGTGIGHQIVVEQLYAVPGAFVVSAKRPLARARNVDYMQQQEAARQAAAAAEAAKKSGCLPKLAMLLLPFAALGTYLFTRS